MKKIYAIIATLLIIAIVGVKVSALSKYGSTGSEVTKIQQTLQSLGYYYGDIDGIYGSQTRNAVTSFQRDVGLTPDGIAGSKTLLYLGLSDSSGNYGYSQSEIDLLARIISAESIISPPLRLYW